MSNNKGSTVYCNNRVIILAITCTISFGLFLFSRSMFNGNDKYLYTFEGLGKSGKSSLMGTDDLINVNSNSANPILMEESIRVLAEEFGSTFSETLEKLKRRGVLSNPSHIAAILRIHKSKVMAAGNEAEKEPGSNALNGVVLDKELITMVMDNDENEKDGDEEAMSEKKEMEKEKNLVNSAGHVRSKWEDGTWRDKSKKYLLFQQSGGMSNQRIILENALVLCRALNRTCIIPMAARHTSMWWNFNKEPLESLMSMSELIDMNLIKEQVADLVLLDGITLRRFIAVNEENPEFGATWKRVIRGVLERRAHPWTMKEVLDMFAEEKADILFFAQGTMWQCFDFYANRELESVQRFVRLHPNLRQIARVAAKAIGPAHNSLHIRFMDGDGTELRSGLLKPNTDFVRRMKVFQTVTKTLYVATIPSKRKSAYFNAFIKAGYKLYFSDSLDEHVTEYLKTVPKTMHETVLGLIEQLVCARGKYFLGTGFSTFSEHIRRMRRHRLLVYDPTLVEISSKAASEQSKEMFSIQKGSASKSYLIVPGIYPQYGNANAVPKVPGSENDEDVKRELSFLSESTSCIGPTKVC